MKLRHLRNHAFMLRNFRNALSLIRTLRGGPPTSEAVEWSGVRLVHPQGQGGFVGTLVELWVDQCYTNGGFYRSNPGDIMVDVGAHVGLFSIWMARQNPRCRIVALEPFAENYACLVENVKATRLPQIIPYCVAVGGEPGEGRVEARTDRSIDHRLVRDASPGAGSVPICTLDQLFDLARSDRIHFLKMDIEGAERDAFEAASPGTLRRIERISMEYHDNLVPNTLAALCQKLEPTHRVRVFPTEDRGYGTLRAELRS